MRELTYHLGHYLRITVMVYAPLFALTFVLDLLIN